MCCIHCIKTPLLGNQNCFGTHFQLFDRKGYWGVQKLPDMGKKVDKNVWKKFLTRGQNRTRKWMVEVLVILCGAFMDTPCPCPSAALVWQGYCWSLNQQLVEPLSQCSPGLARISLVIKSAPTSLHHVPHELETLLGLRLYSSLQT